MIYSVKYPKARFITVEIDRSTGVHQILHTTSLSHSECICVCQSRGIAAMNIDRVLMFAHKDDGE